MLGIRIIKTAATTIVTNWRAVLSIFVGPSIIMFAALMALGFTIVSSPTDVLGPAAAMLPLLLWILVAISITWPIVAWHRFIILGEKPRSILPRFHWWPTITYFGLFVGILLLAGIVAMPLSGLIISLSAMEFPDTSTPPTEESLRAAVRPDNALAAILVSVLTIMLPMLLWLRLCLVLPGAAIGDHLGLSGSWRMTKRMTGSLILIVLSTILVWSLGTFALHVVGSFAGTGTVIDLIMWYLVHGLMGTYSVALLSSMYVILVKETGIEEPEIASQAG